MNSDLLYSVFLGVSVSAACGLRAFLPALVFSIGASSGYVLLPEGFSWISSPVAVAAFAAAAAAELAASFSAKAERLLDAAATPAAMLLGSLLTMASLVNVHFLTGTLLPPLIGITVGGLSQSLAGLLHARAVASSGSRGRTRGAAAEAGGALALSALGVLFPPAGCAVVIVLLAALSKNIREAVLR
jgi:hypothetical protein